MVDTVESLRAELDAKNKLDEANKRLSESQKESNQLTEQSTVFTNGAREAIDFYNREMGKLNISLNVNDKLTKQQTAAFGILATVAFGAHKALADIAGVKY